MMAATIIGFSAISARAEEELDWLALLPVWHQFYSLEAGGGYKDNPTLAHSNPQSAGFQSTTADAFLSRDFLEGSKLNFLFSGQKRHFFQAPSIDDEWTALAVVQGEKEFLEGSQGLLTVSYAYEDQVVDVSVTETERLSVRLSGHRIAIRPGFRPYMPGNTRVTLELPVRRQWLLAPLDSYWEFGPDFEIRKVQENDAYVEAAFEINLRVYDTFEALDRSGNSIAGTKRILLRHDLHLDWRKPWDDARRWRTLVRGGARVNQDNGEGYLDYLEFYGNLGVYFHDDKWTLSADIGASNYRFAHQTVNGGTSNNRERTELNLSLQCERKVSRNFSLVGSYEYEQILGNDPLDPYHAGTVRGAVKWEF